MSWSEVYNEDVPALVQALSAADAGKESPYFVDLSFNRIQGIESLLTLFKLLQERPHLSVCVAGNYFGEPELRRFVDNNGFSRYVVFKAIFFWHAFQDTEKLCSLIAETRVSMTHTAVERNLREAAMLSVKNQKGLETLHNDVSEFTKATKDRLLSVEGFQDKEADGIEREVTAAVLRYLEGHYPNHNIEELEVNKLHRPDGSLLLQIDGGFFITPKDSQEGSVLAIIEAKHNMTRNKARSKLEQLNQFEKYLKTDIANLGAMDVEAREKYLQSTHRRFRTKYPLLLEWSRSEVLIFLGGPCWGPEAVTDVLRKGAAVVTPRGGRYEVEMQ